MLSLQSQKGIRGVCERNEQLVAAGKVLGISARWRGCQVVAHRTEAGRQDSGLAR